MFRDFSFNPVTPPAYALYEAERAAMNVSPTSTSSPARLSHPSPRPPTPPCTMGDLALQLDHHSLRIDTAFGCGPARPPTPGSDSEEGPDCHSQHDRPTYSRIAASVLRMQRQHNSRLQCSSSHTRDISRLVKMIQHEEQCTVSAPPTPSAPSPPLSTSTDDEAVDMDYDFPAKHTETLIDTPVWRAGDRRESCVRVTKSVRMRKRSKEHGVSKRPSSSLLSSSSS